MCDIWESVTSNKRANILFTVELSSVTQFYITDHAQVTARFYPSKLFVTRIVRNAAVNSCPKAEDACSPATAGKSTPLVSQILGGHFGDWWEDLYQVIYWQGELRYLTSSWKKRWPTLFSRKKCVRLLKSSKQEFILENWQQLVKPLKLIYFE